MPRTLDMDDDVDALFTRATIRAHMVTDIPTARCRKLLTSRMAPGDLAAFLAMSDDNVKRTMELLPACPVRTE